MIRTEISIVVYTNGIGGVGIVNVVVDCICFIYLSCCAGDGVKKQKIPPTTNVKFNFIQSIWIVCGVVTISCCFLLWVGLPSSEGGE
jgi:hypothetical protein